MDKTCLLCNNYFDQKPHFSQENEPDQDGEYFADFKEAFQLFCKFITVVSNGGKGNVNNNKGLFHGGELEEEVNGFAPELNNFRKGHPCCGDCNMALLNLLRCDKIIKEAEVRKKEVLERLMMTIVDNRDTHKCQLDEVWLPVRTKLVQCLEATEMNCSNSNEAEIHIAQPATNDIDYIDDDDSFFQGLENEPFHINYVLPDLQDPAIVVESSPLLPDPLEEEPPIKRRRGRPRKQVPDSRAVKNKDVKTSSIKTKPCSIPLSRIRVEDYPELKIDLKTPRKERQSVRKRLRKVPGASKPSPIQSNRPQGQGKGINYKNVYYLICEDILLFQNTCIKFNPSGFTCLEPECSHFVAGSDYLTFQSMRAHVNECHGGVFEDKISCRPCPLCEKTFEDGKSIRNHILEKHTPGRVSTRSTVICESCWKPMQYHCYLYHTWFHKSQEEKDAALAGSETVSRNFKIMLGLVNKNCGLRNRKAKVGQRGRKRKPSTSSSDESTNESELNVQLDSNYNPESSIKSAESGISDGEFEIQPKLLASKPEAKSRTRGKPKKKKNQLNRSRNRGGNLRRARSKRGKRGEGLGVHFRNVFYMITEDVLLFENTLMKLDPNRLTCLETGCSYFVTGAVGTDYSTFQEMKAHVQQNHDNMDVRDCSLCGENFADGKSIRKHILSHTPHRIYVHCTIICESCLKPMPFNRYLYHTWYHKNEEEKAAAIASGEKISSNVKRSIGLVNRLSNVMQSRFMDGDFFFKFGNNYLIHKDILIEFNPTQFICREGLCNTKIQSSDYDTFMAFQEHVKASHNSLSKNIKRFCPLCPDSKFTDIHSFKQHIFHSHSPVGVCTSCWKPIKSYTSMGKHVWLHMNEEERAAAEAEGRCTGSYFPVRQTEEVFSCTSCSKRFAKLSYLRTHEKIHVPNNLRRTYSCDQCAFQVLHKKSLDDHIEIKHKPKLDSKRDLKCSICGQTFHFRRGTEFKTHMRSHFGETPFVCEICGKNFISSKTLRVHTRSVHVTVRPYQCEYCEKSYKLRYVLNLHQRRVHKELLPQTDLNEKLKHTPLQYRPDVMGPVQMFPCEHCDDKVFEFRSRLKYHMKISHPEVT